MTETKRERYISPIPGGKGYIVRVTRRAGAAYAKDIETARDKRNAIFQELFDQPYSDEAAQRVSYGSNKGSDRRGVEFVQLRSGKAFWQVKYRSFSGPEDLVGRLRIRKFFVSRWGHEEGYNMAVSFKDQQDQLEKQHRERQNPPQGNREDQ